MLDIRARAAHALAHTQRETCLEILTMALAARLGACRRSVGLERRHTRSSGGRRWRLLQRAMAALVPRSRCRGGTTTLLLLLLLQVPMWQWQAVPRRPAAEAQRARRTARLAAGRQRQRRRRAAAGSSFRSRPRRPRRRCPWVSTRPWAESWSSAHRGHPARQRQSAPTKRGPAAGRGVSERAGGRAPSSEQVVRGAKARASASASYLVQQ